MKLLIFSILVIVQYLMDRFTSKCATYTGELLLFFHHIMAVYIYFGPFPSDSDVVFWPDNSLIVCGKTKLPPKYKQLPKDLSK